METATEGLHGLYQDGKQSVRPRLCELSQEVMGSILCAEILGTLPKQDRTTILKEFFPENARPRVDSIKRKCKRNRHNDLTFIVQWLGRTGYTPQVLLSRKGAAAAYRLLIKAVGALGPILVAPHPRSPRDAAFYDDQRALVLRACGEFCNKLFLPDCWTAYFWNCRQNQLSILGSEGLRFPEAMYGSISCTTYQHA